MEPKNLLTENQVISITCDYLDKTGFKILATCTTKQKGKDIIAVGKDGKKLYIEAKGDTSSVLSSKRYGKAFSGKQIWNHVAVAVLKTMTDMNLHDPNGMYGIAVPISHKEIISWIKPSLEKLSVVVYLVSENEVSIL